MPRSTAAGTGRPATVAFPPEALLEAYPGPMRDIAQAFRVVVRSAVPDAIERVRVGWRIIGYDVPVGRRTAYFCWIMTEPVHVHLGFTYGVLMRDPDGLLEGDIPRARWVTRLPGEDIDAPRLEWLVREAARVATLSPAERLAATVDRDLGPGEATRRQASGR
jgi:hypothetical protein